MTENKILLSDWTKKIKSSITFGDGRTQEVARKGTIVVKSKNGLTTYIQDVLYVHGLAQNLLNVGQLLQKGYMVNFDENKCLVMDKKEGHLIALVSMVPNKIFH